MCSARPHSIQTYRDDHHEWSSRKIILEWTTRLDTSSRTLFVREGGRMSVRMSTSRRTSSYVIT